MTKLLRAVVGALVLLALLTGLPVAASQAAHADPPASDWARLRTCESSGRYDVVATHGHYGAYQFDVRTWRSVGGVGLPSDATPAEQDYRALYLYRMRGWQPWECAGILGLRPDAGARSRQVPNRAEAAYIAPNPRPQPARAPAGPAGPPPWPGKVYAFGDCDPVLRAWQRRMNSFGYDFEGTGCYREETRQAVLALQRARGIPESGRLGPRTWRAAWTTNPSSVPPPAAPAPAVPAPATPPAPPAPSPTVPPTVPPTTPPPTTTPAPPATPPSADGVQAAVQRKWGRVVAGDEFTYTGPPDPGRWSVYNSPGHQGNGLRRPSAIRVDGSKVVVTGDESGTTGGMAATFDNRRFGRWETRMAVPAGDDEYHPVLILWPDSNNFPCEGEVDYAESTAASRTIDFFLHYSCSNQQTTAKKTLDLTQWHNYAVEWTPSCVTGFVDGAQWFQDCTPSHNPPKPMHQTIQLDYFPDGTPGVGRSAMHVDWVRVYDL